jgi:benzylsuccinate CoA-transferase BbsF subunit
LDELIAEATRGWDAALLADALTARGVAASAVLTADDLLHSDAQLAARGHWVTLEHPVMGPSIYDGIPYRLSRNPGHLRSPAPLLGADTREVCTELLGVPEDNYDALVSEGAVG